VYAMAKKHTKQDKGQLQADQLEKKIDRHPAQSEKKRPANEDVNRAAVRIVREATKN